MGARTSYEKACCLDNCHLFLRAGHQWPCILTLFQHHSGQHIGHQWPVMLNLKPVFNVNYLLLSNVLLVYHCKKAILFTLFKVSGFGMFFRKQMTPLGIQVDRDCNNTSFWMAKKLLLHTVSISSSHKENTTYFTNQK